jgi:glutamate formiminotransferase/formiminotetrahydrofolate cyclodeaminase
MAEDGTLDDLLDGLEAAAPSPAGGTAAAVTAAMAASLVAMVGRGSTAWPAGADVAERATALRQRLRVLGTEDVDAFADVLAAYRARRAEPERGDAELVAFLLRASEVPLEITERAADVTELAGAAAQDGHGSMRPDAVAAGYLAAAAARAAALLVEGNLSALPAGAAADTAARLRDQARRAVARAGGA